MAPGESFKDQADVLKLLKPGQGIVIVKTASGIQTWGTPKNMARECSAIADEKVGALMAHSAGLVSVLIQGSVTCNFSENSIICRNCPGL